MDIAPPPHPHGVTFSPVLGFDGLGRVEEVVHSLPASGQPGFHLLQHAVERLELGVERVHGLELLVDEVVDLHPRLEAVHLQVGDGQEGWSIGHCSGMV